MYKNYKILELSDSYIKDGKLIKFRWYNGDHNHIDNKLHYKYYKKEEVTNEEYEYLCKRGNLVVDSNNDIEFINFDKDKLEYL